MSDKRCPTCDTTKPLDAFGKDKARHDGHCAICKACRSAKGKSDYKADPAKFVKRSAEWASKNRERANKSWREAILKRKKADPDKFREWSRKSAKNQQVLHPDRVRARWRVSKAIRDGRIVRPGACTDCGKVGPTRRSGGGRCPLTEATALNAEVIAGSGPGDICDHEDRPKVQLGRRSSTPGSVGDGQQSSETDKS